MGFVGLPPAPSKGGGDVLWRASPSFGGGRGEATFGGGDVLWRASPSFGGGRGGGLGYAATDNKKEQMVLKQR